jgi:hypothetical protein
MDPVRSVAVPTDRHERGDPLTATAAQPDGESIPRRVLGTKIRRVSGDLVVGDQDGALSLADSAEFLFKNCDGRRSVLDLAHLLAQEYDVGADEVFDDVVELLVFLGSRRLVEFNDSTI